MKSGSGPLASAVTFSVALSATFSVVGCNPSVDPGLAQRWDSAGVTIVHNDVPSAAAGQGISVLWEPEVVLGRADAQDEPSLFRVRDARRMEDGTIVVANSGTSELLVYDASGSHLRTLGGEGEGPGDYRSPSWIAALGDTLVVYDPFQGTGRLTFLSVTGEVFSGQTLTVEGRRFPNPRTMFPNGLLLDQVSEGSIPVNEVGHVVYTRTPVLYPRTGSPVDTFPPLPGGEAFKEEFRGGISQSSVPFGRSDFTAWTADHLFFGDGDTFEVDVFDLAGTQIMSIRRRHEPVPVTDDLVERWIAATLDQEIFRQRPDAAERSRRRFEEAPKPSTLPAHGELVADALGVLWVQNYSPPWEDSNIWSLFNFDGSWLCDVELPPGLQVMEIGEGFLLGLRKDELDVEYLQLHRVVRG